MAKTRDALSVENGPARRGLQVRRLFTTRGTHPYDELTWERRDAVITNWRDGTTAFEQRDLEFTATWSQNSTNIVAQKYFRGQLDSPSRERSVKQMIGRVAGTIADWGRQRGYFATAEDGDAFQDELTYILLHQMAAFNSPVWFNVGFEEQPQCSACFILSVEDTMESILDWNTREGRIFRGGSGSGINLSNIRGSMEPLSKGGTASGPVSFMRGADSWAGTIKSGGKTRRAAKMVVLDVDHPDIVEFIECKAKEEDKAEALARAGFDMSIDGDGFNSIQYQNANNSVRVTDEFMQAVEADEEWRTIARSTGKPIGEPLRARDVMRKIAEAAWRCADPGVQYDTIINEWHTCPNSGRINASNPCSEYMHVDDSACNLASLNLMKFRRADGTFEVEKFARAVDVVFLAQEIVVGPSSYPTEEIGVNARAFRQLGMGYANLGAYLMANGMPYDSESGRATAAAITALMTGRAYLQSAKIAAAVGPYERYAENREAHNNVMRMHRDATAHIPVGLGRDDTLLSAAREVWDEAVEVGEQHGYRNAQATVLAPTGTISFLMDCDTTGIEPDFSLVKYKKLVGGGSMQIVNQTVPRALRSLGYQDEQIEAIVEYIAEHGHVVDAPSLRPEHYEVFDCAMGERAISPMGHVRMMAAVQPFISGAISKTVNMPETATVEDVENIYFQGWKLGLKALAIYRDNCKVGQPLSDAKAKKADAKVEVAVAPTALSHPVRKRLPKKRTSVTTSFSVAGAEGYMTAGMYEDGSLGEVFLKLGKQGSTLAGVMDAFSISLSIALQHGVPLETYIQKFTNMRFEPAGMTDDPDIRIAQSVMDYIFRRLALDHLPVEKRANLGIFSAEERAAQVSGYGTSASTAAVVEEEVDLEALRGSAPTEGPAKPEVKAEPAKEAHSSAELLELVTGTATDAPLCMTCGTKMRPAGSCYVCEGCGSTSGCS